MPFKVHGRQKRGARWYCMMVLLKGLDSEIVEMRDAVGLGPQRHAAGGRDRRIGRAVEALAVEEDFETAAACDKPQFLPFAGGPLGIGAGELAAPAAPPPIGAYIVLESVGAHDVVVVGIAEPDRDARRPVDLA